MNHQPYDPYHTPSKGEGAADPPSAFMTLRPSPSEVQQVGNPNSDVHRPKPYSLNPIHPQP